MDPQLFTSSAGQGWAFPPRFNPYGKAAQLVNGPEDIYQSLFVLLNTTPGERIMDPFYGCALRHFLFGTPTLSMLTQLQDVVNKAILRFEPRIAADPVRIDTSRLTDGVLLLEVSYALLDRNSRNNAVFPFYLQEGTLLP